MSSKIQAMEILDELIVGRVSPKIYAFTTETVPNYLKIGDTYRPVAQRLKEWKVHFPTLKKEYEESAKITDSVYFRDFAVHNYIEKDLKKPRLSREDLYDNVYFSNEFFKEATSDNIKDAICDIKDSYKNNLDKYDYYDGQSLPVKYNYQRGEYWDLRPNQQVAVDNFVKAYKKGRTNLLMYAVMRFGKSFTSLYCGLQMNAKIILIVSAKVDVKEEWKKTVESAGNFHEYIFLSSDDLLRDENIIDNSLNENKKIVLFLTLQDLQGKNIKGKHKEVFKYSIDLLIVDETHFGARGKEYGAVLQNTGYTKKDEKSLEINSDDKIYIEEADRTIKTLNAKVKLHLSGTPYRILMGSEFEKEDIISFVQFSDIVKEMEEWDRAELLKDNVNEWDNPYYGFPQMIRFAFNPSTKAIEKMENLKKNGISFAFSQLFKPKNIRKDTKHEEHKEFIHKEEVLDLLLTIDGSKEDENLLGFLGYNKLKEGKMCRHIVIVLPYRASCDALEKLICDNNDMFRNLSEYKIINISGVDGSTDYKNPASVKETISKHEKENKKTITLTVNRMLTGSTVEEWDSMLYFKDTSSPQEYDQAIFRLQNQYTRNLINDNGDTIKENLKPQTLLVDFDPNRLFAMQEQKSLIYNVNTEKNGNAKLKERIEEELRISPVITMNKNKIVRIEATNILDAISEYNKEKSILDEIEDVPIDFNILSDDGIRHVIEIQGEFNSKQGLTLENVKGEGEGSDLDLGDVGDIPDNTDTRFDETLTNQNNYEVLKRKIQTYYQRLLFFSFLTKDKVESLEDIISIIDNNNNIRLASNLSLEKSILVSIIDIMDNFKLSSLDYKIQNINRLSHDESMSPINRAQTSIRKFSRMSASEVITPENIGKDVIELIPREGLIAIIEDGKVFLDMASKSAEFAIAIYKKLVDELDYDPKQIKDKIYSIPTSSVAYEFTYRFYEILGLETDNIADKFNTYDLLKVKDKDDNIDYKQIKSYLTQDKKFSKIKLQEKIKKGGDKMDFGAIVGNPPYQVSDGGAGASSKPIYHHFILSAKEIQPSYFSFIIPTRWFAGGKGLDDFRANMLSDKNIKELHDCLSPENVFPNTNNRGGICYFLSDKSYDNTKDHVRVVTHKDNEIISDKTRTLKLDGIDIFIRDSIAIEILEKIYKGDIKDTLQFWVSPRKPFGIESKIIKTDNFSLNKDDIKDPVICIGKNKTYGFVDRSEITIREHLIDTWKVYVPRANNIGTELIDDNLNSFIGEAGTVCTEAYIAIGSEQNLDKISTNNLTNYMRTKFVRFLHGLAKASQDASSKTYRFIPVQDFTDESDIDWSKSINEIDKQLFNKYKLTEEEYNHIENSINDMK